MKRAASSSCAAVLAVIALSVSCASSDGPAPAADVAKIPSARASAEVDVATIVSRARAAFRADGAGNLAAGGSAYVARVARNGSLRYVPRTRDRSQQRARWKVAPALSVETRSITRGIHLDDGASVADLESDGSIRVRRGSVVEHLANVDAGLEQSWELAEKPRGAGDLEVRVHVDGYAVEPDARGGARLVDAASHTVVSYGAARWVDARGEVTPVPARVEGTDVVLSVPRDVVDRSSYPAVLDPTISTEAAFDAPIVGLTGVPTYSVDVAPGKNGSFLVVWIDERAPGPYSDEHIGNQQIVGARVAANGTVLDPTGLVIGQQNETDQDDPIVTFDGVGTWLVAWGQYSSTENDCEIFTATRVTDAGVVVDPTGIRLGCVFAHFHAGFDGTHFQVVGSAGTSLYGWRVPQSGKVSVAPLATTLLASNVDVGLACDGKTTCLMSWSGSGMVRSSRLGATGLTDPSGVAIAPAGGVPLTTYDGTNFVVAWSNAGIRAARVSTAGAVIDAGGVQISTSGGAGSIASDGASTLVTWIAAGQLVGARLSKAGAPLDAVPLAFTTAAKPQNFALAGGAGQYLLGWIDRRTGTDGLYVGRVSGAGAPLDGDGVAIHRSANREERPTIARSANGYLAVWEDWRDGGSNPALYATRLSDTGVALDVPAKLIAASGSSAYAASDGTDYLVAYQKPGNALDMIRVSGATGDVIGAATALAASGYGPSLLYDGTQFVAAWVSGGAHAMRIDRAGVPIAGILDLGSSGEVAGAYDGQGYMFVLSNGDTLARRVAKDWTLPEAAPFTVSVSPSSDDLHSLAFDAGNYLAVWRRSLQDDTPRGDILGARISPAGVVLDTKPLPIAATLAVEIMPRVVAMNDGVGPLVVWIDNRRIDRLNDYDLLGSVVRAKDGVILDRPPITISGEAGNELFPAVAAVGTGRAIVAYQRLDHASGQGNYRVRSRFVTSGKVGGVACTVNADCASRSCSDGVCCDRPCNAACETCSRTPGTCTPVVSADDPDTCAGDRTCTASAKCLSKLGGPCAVTPDCLQGTCSQGICCDRACDAPCETCAETRGTCTLRAPRSAVEQRCAPYACDGKNAACPTSCDSDDQCPRTGRCDLATRVCVDGALCIDAKTLGRPGQPDQSCAPYTCEIAACRTTCRSVTDCVYPAICDEAGQCIQPPQAVAAVGGGCALVPISTGSRSPLAWLFALPLAFAARSLRRSARTRSKN